MLFLSKDAKANMRIKPSKLSKSKECKVTVYIVRGSLHSAHQRDTNIFFLRFAVLQVTGLLAFKPTNWEMPAVLYLCALIFPDMIQFSSTTDPQSAAGQDLRGDRHMFILTTIACLPKGY